MPDIDPDDLDRVDQEIRINELRHEAEDLAGGKMFSWESEDCPTDLTESFWSRVVAWEKAPRTSHFEQLVRHGFELPDPDDMNDAQLSLKLWQLIHELSQMHVYLSQTNHLSDRELYQHLWQETLHEAIPDLPIDPDGAWHIDILGGCSEEDIALHLKYYADEEWRKDWATRFPDDVIPAHKDPPYDRDRLLPQAEEPTWDRTHEFPERDE